MTNAYAAAPREQTIEFHDLVLIDAGLTHVYGATVNGVELRWETVANPTGREVIDAALWAYRSELAHTAAVAVDEGRV